MTRPPAPLNPQHTRSARIERFLPRILLESPINLVGYGYGCLAGWVWGSLWSTGRVERRNGLWVFRGMPGWSFARGGVCVGNCFLTGSGRIDDRLLKHEATHKRQWRRYGFLLPLLYLIDGRNPLRNRFEIEAGLADGNYLPR